MTQGTILIARLARLSRLNVNSTEMKQLTIVGIPDSGYRSKCCLAPVKVGTKKLKNAGKITIWKCTRCNASEPLLLSIEEAIQIREKDHLALDIEEDSNFSD